MDWHDVGDLTVGELWSWLVWEWDTLGWGSMAVRWTTFTVVTVMFVLGAGALIMLRALGQRIAERAEGRPVAPAGRRAPVFEVGRVGVGPVVPDPVPGRRGRVYAPGAADETVPLRLGAPEPGPPQRWDPHQTIVFVSQPETRPFD